MKKKQSSLLVLVLLVAFTLLIYHDVIFRPGIVFGKDMVVQGYPIYISKANVMTGHSGPGWVTYMMSGYPVPPDELFYPTNWLLFILPATRMITWNYILHSLVGAIFMFLLMRRLGRSTAGSIIAAMAFSFSAFFISKVYAGHGAAIWTGIWIPLVILFLDRTIDNRRAIDAILIGAVLGFQVIGGHPQYLYYTILAAMLFAAWRVLPQFVKTHSLASVGIYFGLAVLAILFMVMVSAPHLLPFTQITMLSNRGGGTDYNFASSLSMHPYQLLNAVTPSFWGSPIRHNSVFGALYWDGALFIGVLPFLLAVIAAIGVRGTHASYFKVLALISILIALGDNTPLFKLIYHIPGFSMVRAPSKILFLYTFAASALAAYGTDVFLSPSRQSTNKKSIKILVGSAIGLITAFLLWFLAKGYIYSTARRVIMEDYDNPHTKLAKLEGLFHLQLSTLAWSAGFAAVGAIVVLMLVRQKMSMRTAGAALTAVVFIDLWMYADPLLFTTNPSKLYKVTDRAAINIMKSDHDHFRILPLDTDSFQYAQGLFDGLESVNGYYPISLARYAAYVGAIENTPPSSGVSVDISKYDSPLVDLLSVKYVLSSKPLTNRNLVRLHSGHQNLYRNKNWLSKAFTVHRVKVVSTPEDALKEIKKPNFNPKSTIIIESNEKLPNVSGNPLQDKVRITSYRSNEIKIQADMASAGYLFLSEVYYPTWKAWVNGRPAEILPANYLFRGIYLPEGQHNIEMRIVDKWSNIGRMLSISSMLFIAVACLISYSRHRKSKGRA